MVEDENFLDEEQHVRRVAQYVLDMAAAEGITIEQAAKKTEAYAQIAPMDPGVCAAVKEHVEDQPGEYEFYAAAQNVFRKGIALALQIGAEKARGS